MQQILTDIYDRLFHAFGPQNWWPAESPFEVVVGAILTQNTNWSNVEKAIANLRTANALTVPGVSETSKTELEGLIRPSGFFRQKAERLRHFVRFLEHDFDGDLNQLFALPMEQLRQTLLAQPGIGPETADSIILYAAGKASFVVDAYTHRIFERLGMEPANTKYEQTRACFMEALPSDVELYNEYHALIVRHAKEYCRKRNPVCPACPLLNLCRLGKNNGRD